MIKAGSAIFGGELGVRFFTVLLSSAGLAVLFQLMPHGWREQRTGYIILLSLPLLNYLAIVVMPDGPLMFFSLLFLYAYKRFLGKEDVYAALLMGLAIALMLYSKYHGALVLLFTILSNPKLLRSHHFLLALLIALLTFSPHLWWQYQNDFVTIEYHLRGRATALTTGFILEYLSQQLLAIGPGLIFVPFVVRSRDPFERALKFVSIGVLAFFLVATLRGFVHTHWTSIALYPIVLLAVPFYQARSTKLGFYLLFVPLGVGLLVLRAYLAFPILPTNHVGIDYYHDRDLWAQDIQAVATNDPVLFLGDGRQAPLYSFYSGQTGVALFPDAGRKSQYELWQYEDSLQETSVTWVMSHQFPGAVPLTTRMGPTVYYRRLPDFASYNNIHVSAEIPDRIEHRRDTLSVDLTIHNHRGTPLTFPATPEGGQPRLVARISGEDSDTAFTLTALSEADAVAPQTSRKKLVAIPVAFLAPGKYHIAFAIHADPLSFAWQPAAGVFTIY